MSDEEKAVLSSLKNDIEVITFNGNLKTGLGNLYISVDNLKILLALIARQQKEIEGKTNQINILLNKVNEEYTNCE